MSEASTYKKDQVVGIINSVLSQMQAPILAPFDDLSNELTELKEIIENLRTQLHDNQVHEIGENIPTAADELDAVLNATEEATHTIMGCCEEILQDMNGAEEALFTKVEANIVKIFEACTFQDVTGQRIKKVSSCLALIEDKTNFILNALDAKNISSGASKVSENDDGDSLMNGPALPQNALSQEDIDKLLADFDE